MQQDIFARVFVYIFALIVEVVERLFGGGASPTDVGCGRVGERRIELADGALHFGSEIDLVEVDGAKALFGGDQERIAVAVIGRV